MPQVFEPSRDPLGQIATALLLDQVAPGSANIIAGDDKQRSGIGIVRRTADDFTDAGLFGAVGGNVGDGIFSNRTVSTIGLPTDLSAGVPDLLNRSELGTFNTIFEKADAGQLGDSAQAVFNSAIGQLGSAGASIGHQLSAPAINVQIPDLPSVEDIGTLTTEVMQNLPPEMQGFIENIFNDASPEAIAAELDNLSSAILTDAENNADSIGRTVLSQFGAEGLGSSGSAQKALQTVATQVAIDANAKIAETRLAGLQTLIRARDQGVQLVDTLTTLGRAEQASRVTQNIAQLEAESRVLTAQIQANAQIQSTLADVSSRLALGQLDFTASMFSQLVSQSNLEEQQRLTGAGIPLQTLLSIGTGSNFQSPNLAESSGGIGGLAGSLAGDLLGSFAGGVGGAAGAAAGGKLFG